MTKINLILVLSNSFSLLSVVVISLCSLITGFFIKLAKYAAAKKRILHLEDEMLSNHARILKLQKKIADFQNENEGISQTKNLLKKVEDLERRVV